MNRLFLTYRSIFYYCFEEGESARLKKTIWTELVSFAAKYKGNRFNDEKNALFKQVNDYGFDVSLDDFHAYLTPLFIKINELTPLEDGNNERNDSRNEDN